MGAPRFALVGTLAAAAALLVFSVFFQSSDPGLAEEQALVSGTPGLSVGTMVLAPLEESPLGVPSGLALRKADPADRPLAEGAVEVLHNLRASGRGVNRGSNRLTSGH
jgi:hypothetical protein